MRIIAGTHRSRSILPPRDSETTRPITDRVKQSLFDRLWATEVFPPAESEWAEGNVLDVFAGTGSLGLEALSRGSAHCTFIEKDRQARTLLEKNLAELELGDRATVMSVDALATGWIGVLGHKPLRVAFIDPPYALTGDAESMAKVATLIEHLPPVMEERGLAVLRTEDKAVVPIIPGWTGPDSHVYGSMALHFFEKNPA